MRSTSETNFTASEHYQTIKVGQLDTVVMSAVPLVSTVQCVCLDHGSVHLTDIFQLEDVNLAACRGAQ